MMFNINVILEEQIPIQQGCARKWKTRKQAQHSNLISWCLPHISNPTCVRSHCLSIVSKLSVISTDRYCSKERLLLGPQRHHLNFPQLPRKLSRFLICSKYCSTQRMCHSRLSVFWQIYDHTLLKNSWTSYSIICYRACGRKKKPETLLFTKNICCLFLEDHLVSFGEHKGKTSKRREQAM